MDNKEEIKEEEATLYSKINKNLKTRAEQYCFDAKKLGLKDREHLYQLIELALDEYISRNPIPTQM